MKLGLDTNVLVYASMADMDEHAAVNEFLAWLVAERHTAVLTPPILYEFVHVATDGRRFEQPLSMSAALERARRWMSAREVTVLRSTPETLARTLELLEVHNLGRKRILDAALAATLLDHGVSHLATRNTRDFELLGLETIDPIRPQARENGLI